MRGLRSRNKTSHGRHRSTRRPLRQRAVLAMPNGMTLANLFFGVFAIIAASRGDFIAAGWYVVISGIFDVLDGRIARATESGTRVGAELDSLVDLISFGLAPAMIMYFAVLNHSGNDWIWAFIYIAAAAWRLAVFNVEQAGRAKKYFHGLPSPAAGLTLATYYWFSQTSLYTQTNIYDLPWHQMMRFVMLGLAALMISPIPYPAFPAVGFKNRKEIFTLVFVVAVVIAMFWIPREFFFPACLIYIFYGLGKTFLFGLFNRRTDNEPMAALAPEDIPTMHEPIIAVASPPRLAVSADTPLPSASSGARDGQRRRRRRRPPRGPSNRSDKSDKPDKPDKPDSPPPSGE